jgi:COP9 signalosome complex subunit 7
LGSPIDLEHLVTQAIYSNLLTGILNPAAQTVVITSVSPLRDLAPGSIATMMSELEAWSSRCEGVLGDLEKEIARVKADAAKRSAAERKAERQVKAVTEAAEKSGGGGGAAKGGHNTRGGKKLGSNDDDDDDGDGMDVDGGLGRAKRGGHGGGGLGGLLGRFGGRGR